MLVYSFIFILVMTIFGLGYFYKVEKDSIPQDIKSCIASGKGFVPFNDMGIKENYCGHPMEFLPPKNSRIGALNPDIYDKMNILTKNNNTVSKEALECIASGKGFVPFNDMGVTENYCGHPMEFLPPKNSQLFKVLPLEIQGPIIKIWKVAENINIK